MEMVCQWAGELEMPHNLLPMVLVLKWKYLHWDNKVLVEQLVYTATMVLTFSPFRKRNILKTLVLMFLVAPSHCITAMGSLHPPSGTSSEHCRERQSLFSEMQA